MSQTRNAEAAAAPAALGDMLRRSLPLLLYGVRLWAATCLALFVAFSLELENPFWAGTTAAIVCQPVLGASLRKGWFRLIGTVIGACAAVVLTALFPQDRFGFLLGLAVWGGACAFVSSLLRNFASYAAALSGYTAAIICSDELGQVGGANGEAFTLAVTRASEICIGIVCAGLVLALTDYGGARRQLAAQLRSLTLDVAAGLARALRLPAEAQAATRADRRGLHLQVAGLDTVIDQASGEISGLPFRPRVLQGAVDGLAGALSAWRSVANHLEHEPAARTERLAGCLPQQWSGDPAEIRDAMRQAARCLVALPADSPSDQLLIDRLAEGLLRLVRAMNGVVLLAMPGRVTQPSRVARLRVPDFLPPVLNAWRAFLTIMTGTLIWIVTAWPGGVTFVLFGTITAILFSPREDQAFTTARNFMLGTTATAAFAAVIAFAVLPQVESYAGFCLALGLVLIPAGALSAQPWQQGVFVAMEANFIPLLGPANPMTYDPGAFFNTALALLGGVGLGLLAFRLFPPMPPALRAQRLLGLTLRDLRRLAAGRRLDWEGHVYGRLAVMPDSVDSVFHARMAAALSVGSEVIRLRHTGRNLGLDTEPAMRALAAGDSTACREALARLDADLAEAEGGKPALRARGALRAVAEALARHAEFFDAETI